MVTDNEITEITSEEAAELRHDEMMSTLKGLVTSLKSKDSELYNVLYKNIEALGALSSSIKAMVSKEPAANEIKIESNHDKVIEAVNEMSKKLNEGMEKMIQCLSKEPVKQVESKREYSFTIIRDPNGNMQSIIAKQK